MPSLAIVAVDRAENEPSKNLQNLQCWHEVLEERQWALYLPVKRLLSSDADDRDPLRLRLFFFLPESYPDGDEPPLAAFDEEVAAEIRRKVLSAQILTAHPDPLRGRAFFFFSLPKPLLC